MLYTDVIETRMDNVVHVELYTEAHGVRIVLSCIMCIYGGFDRKHCVINIEFYCKLYVARLVMYLVEYVKLSPWRM